MLTPLDTMGIIICYTYLVCVKSHLFTLLHVLHLPFGYGTNKNEKQINKFMSLLILQYLC